MGGRIEAGRSAKRWQTLWSIGDLLERPGASGTARAVRTGLLVLVALGLAALVLGTMPGLSPAQDRALTLTMLAVSLIFIAEYGLRLWAAQPPGPAEPACPARSGRRSFAASPLGLVDLVSGVALPLALVAGLPAPPRACSAPSGSSRSSATPRPSIC